MKTLLTTVVAAFALGAFAETKVPAPLKDAPKSQLTEAERAARKAAGQKIMMEKTGGMVERPGTGKIAVVNCQSKFSKEVFDKQLDLLRKVTRVQVDFLTAEPITAATLFSRMEKLPDGVAVALYLIDDATLPISLHAPEAQWMVVNAARLNESQFPKEFSRAISFAFGCNVSKFKGSPMQTVTKPEDLDRIVADGVAFDSLPSIQMHLQALGVTPAKKATYRKACMDGWAAQPTNDYQKAIWEEVHAKPTNPMRIKYDPKKGE